MMSNTTITTEPLDMRTDTANLTPQSTPRRPTIVTKRLHRALTHTTQPEVEGEEEAQHHLSSLMTICTTAACPEAEARGSEDVEEQRNHCTIMMITRSSHPSIDMKKSTMKSLLSRHTESGRSIRGMSLWLKRSQ